MRVEVSSPQVSAILMSRRGLKPSSFSRTIVSTHTASWAFMSDVPRPIEIAVLLDQGERIAGPVLAPGFHHIQMAKQQDGLGLWIAAMQNRHQAAFLGMAGRGEGMQVGVGIARRFRCAAIFCAARVQSPADRVVLVSTNSL